MYTTHPDHTPSFNEFTEFTLLALQVDLGVKLSSRL